MRLENSILNRRAILKAAGTLALATSIPSLLSSTTVLAKSSEQEVLSISDGHLSLPVNAVIPKVPGLSLEEMLKIQEIAEKLNQPECNLTLFKDGKTTALFDAGSGSNFMQTTGRLLEQMDSNGLSVDDVTDVIFTHGHPDHLWGILDEFDEVTFPNATLHFPRKEWDFWTSEDAINQVAEDRQTFVVGAQNRLSAMEEQIKLFDSGAAILTNVEAVDTNGHTPGHTSFVIHAANKPIMVLGDALTNYRFSFEHPEWQSKSDQDSELGVKTRLALLERVESEKMKFVGYHLPNDGIGRAEKFENTYKFIQDS